jgi:hypothetical protein
VLPRAFQQEARSKKENAVSRRRRSIELEDASHFVLVAMWQRSAHLFPRSLHLRSRVVPPSPDVVEMAAAFSEHPMVFFSAWLSCGHVVQVPGEILVKAVFANGQPRFRSLVPCYKCWRLVDRQPPVAGMAIACSFCGVGHDSSVSCIRPHLER